MTALILKVTEKCNSNCAYCDVVMNKTRAKEMSLEVLELVFQRINEYLKNDPDEQITLIWHGGEPMLPGPDYYRAATQLFHRICGNTKNRINQMMQSNLTLFSEDFVRIFRELGINQMGTSYDPEPHLRGPGSPNNSDLYNRQFMRGHALAVKHGFGAGIIYVITQKSLKNPLDIFIFLSNLSPGGGFNMNPVLIYDNERQDLAITPEEYVSFLGAIFPFWWEHRKRYFDMQPFNTLTKIIRDKENCFHCAESGECAFNHINIDPSGEASHCGRSSDWDLLSYGNVRDRSLEEILSDPQRKELSRRNQILLSGECRDCRLWNICHGGCPLDPYPEHSSFMHKSKWGCARGTFIKKHFEPVTGLRYAPDE